MARLWAVLLLAPMIGGCAMQLVQPYDAKLVSGAEAFYKKAATMVQEGRAASPGSDAERAAIADPSAHPAHFSRFESRYDKLVIESEALILRAAAAELGERGADRAGHRGAVAGAVSGPGRRARAGQPHRQELRRSQVPGTGVAASACRSHPDQSERNPQAGQLGGRQRALTAMESEAKAISPR
ncbi:MAG: hypothetical protein AB2814_09520 [Candidatus Sedimenticola endophacoides]